MVTPDHPRSRGEYQLRVRARAGASGSSPLSRGILTLSSGVLLRLWIIPALAGNTLGLRLLATPLAGSSPLSRGIPLVAGPGRRPGRIIPALAGNTSPAPRKRLGLSDHPRSRGEYIGV